ncbi:MAG: efflux RND transporter periplasmic adaptor subunit [bacterium]|nr:efflux RND transporter periplasmic adaptor subunit [bacterium]
MSMFLKSRYKWVVLIAAVSGIAWGTYKFWPSKEKEPELPMLVEVESIKKSDLRKTVRLSAVVNPKRVTVFKAQEKGVMGPPLVKSGDLVQEGTLLAQMRNEKWHKAVEYTKEKANLAQAHYQSQKKLVDSKNKSQRALDVAHKAWLSAKIAYEEAKKELAKTQFKAPYSGQVGIFKAREGQFLKDGNVVVAFYDTSEYVLDIDVPESFVTLLKVGEVFKFGEKEGKIESVQTFLDPGTHMGLARATFPSDVLLPLGGRVSIEVSVAQRENVLSVPRSAIALKDGNLILYKIVKGKAAIAWPEIGLETNDRVEVLDGISVGDRIIIKGHGGLWPTKEVKDVNAQKEADEETQEETSTKDGEGS